MTEEYPTSVDELKERIEECRQRLLGFVDNLPDRDRDEIRDPAGWSAKDHVAHLTMWERSMAYLLTGRPRHEGLGVDLDTYLSHDLDRMNDAIFQQHRGRAWPDVRVEFDQVHDELLATLEALGWDELQHTYSHFAPDEPGEERGDPVVYYVAGNTFQHYDEHRGWIEELLERGRSADGGS